jgi:hypothetical protein
VKIPIECPVCGADHIEPIQRQSLVRLEDEGGTDTVAFRCGQGHIFVLSQAEERSKDSDKVVPFKPSASTES